jgi:hypothetical protein
MKKVFLMVLILLYQYLMGAQCPKEWEVGSGIGACKFEGIPQIQTISAAEGAVLNFSIRFDDSDKVRTCTGNERVESNDAAYEITFTISDGNGASFESAASNITSKSVEAKVFSPIYPLCDRTGTLWNSKSVTVFIKAGIAIRSIKVKALIKDVTMLPADATGNLHDSPVSHTWTIKNDVHPCPTALLLQPAPLPSPSDQNKKWIDPYPRTYEVYTYKCSDGLPTGSTPDYENKLISESFANFSADSFFTMADVDRTYLPADVVNANQLAEHLFSQFVGEPATFVVDSGNLFTDAHGTITRVGLEKSLIFLGLDAMSNKKCGFSIEQTYRCNGRKITAPILYKRAFLDQTSSLITEIRKSH